MHDSDYLKILEALQELPFNVGKTTLVDLVCGAVTKKMVANQTYMDLACFGSLEGKDARTVRGLVDQLLANGLIETTIPPGTHWKLLAITAKGRRELKDPQLLTAPPTIDGDVPSAAAQELIKQFSFHLGRFTPAQQHAIAAPEKRIRCIAGAGTGKTTVLTERVRFLATFRGVAPERILAVTFTRKARQEMEERLDVPAHIVTFNGLCHRLLQAHGEGLPIITYGQKRKLFQEALAAQGLVLGALIQDYYTRGQRQRSTQDELARGLLRDVFGLIDHFSNEDEEIPKSNGSELATTLLGLARRIDESMRKRGLRDYSGQLRDALAMLRAHPERVPRYDHILVDEYQDVNQAQRELLDLLAPEHLFVVGDPRQSIYGWRGSRIEHILDFPADVTVQLRENHRSAKSIIAVANTAIKPMGLPDLRGSREEEGAFQVLRYGSEDEELAAVAGLAAGLQGDVFILARTNQQLQDLSALLKRRGVTHAVRHEDDEDASGGLTLATVHAIKGLEAQSVVALGAADRYYPIKASDHPVVDLITAKGLDKDAEERRLLYVALTRAKDTLIVTYHGTPSRFLDGIGERDRQKSLGRDDGAYERLRAWRATIAKERGLPAYCILSDKTLREVADAKPDNQRSLGEIHGMGPAKLAQFGEELLELVRKG